MSDYNEYIRKARHNELIRFFGEVRKTSNKYFRFTHRIDNDNIAINTENVRFIKGSPVLVVGNSDCVYLKDWNVREAHNYENGMNFHVVKLSRQYFKTYTFRRGFDVDIPQVQTFDDLVKIAEEQDAEDMPIATGRMN